MLKRAMFGSELRKRGIRCARCNREFSNFSARVLREDGEPEHICARCYDSDASLHTRPKERSA